MSDDRDQGILERSATRRWRILRIALFAAAVSLAVYMPYKAFTQYDRLQDIYGPWFLQGLVVAVAGLVFMWRPALVARIPLVLRLGIGAAALLWMQTGLACTPSLIKSLQASLLAGGFASFHMLAQHVFLSLGVLLAAAAPVFFVRKLGLAPEPAAAGSAKLSPEPNK